MPVSPVPSVPGMDLHPHESLPVPEAAGADVRRSDRGISGSRYYTSWPGFHAAPVLLFEASPVPDGRTEVPAGFLTHDTGNDGC